MNNIMIIGASSAIAVAVARQFAVRGCKLFLAARNAEQLEIQASDLTIRGAESVTTASFEAIDFDSHAALLRDAAETLGKIDLLFICHGSLPDQQACIDSYAATADAVTVNGTSVISLLTEARLLFSEQRSGCIAVVTSVAGDRGRQPNYVYGAAKALVSTYLQGMRAELHDSGVQVIDIRPGFVDTPMTAHLEKGPLFASPETVAGIIVKSIDKKRHTVYAPFYWRFILAIVRNIPDVLFKRLKI